MMELENARGVFLYFRMDHIYSHAERITPENERVEDAFDWDDDGFESDTYDVGCGEVYTNNDERLFMRNDDDFEEEWESSPRADADLANRIEDSNTELLEKFPRTDSFAKILKSDGSFQYIRVLEIVKFVHNEKWKRIHRMTGKVTKFNTKMFAFKMKYREMDVVRLWKDCIYD